MRDSTDLKETILREAQELFAAHGYAGTSIKQIAGASGCTTAALYYYFADGKSQILREVVRSSFSPQLTTVIQAGRDATSLANGCERLAMLRYNLCTHAAPPNLDRAGDAQARRSRAGDNPSNLLDAHQQSRAKLLAL